MVIISNGFNKFHLAVAAAEAHRLGILSLYITGAYPTPLIKKSILSIGLGRNRKLTRLLNRREEIPDALVRPLWLTEGVYSTAMALRHAAPNRLIAFICGLQVSRER